MTPNFDFSAFLNSPAAGTDQGHLGMSDSTAMVNADSNDIMGNLDDSQMSFGNDMTYNDSNILPEWASASNVVQDLPTETTAAVQTMDASDKTGDGTAAVPNSSYRNKIAAHHMAQLSTWLPQIGGAAGGASAGLGGVGQRSQGGSHSSPSVPLSQASRLQVQKQSSILTIQERRRLARRGQAAGLGVSQPTGLQNVVNANANANENEFATPQLPASAIPQPNSSGGLEMSNFLDSAPIATNVYSATGFDLIAALIKVATRPDPKIEIGPVDLSCSFTVSDASHPEHPIIHCSDSFCQLTGYDRTEIIGRNCRFLQAPDGNVEIGTERMHTDNGAVRHIKKNLMKMQECQTSLINYRRDGSPFINLVTVVPITWNNSREPVLFVGFQVDLVEHPGAVIERKPNGLYVVNYTQHDANGLLPRYGQPAHGTDAIKDAAEAEASKKAILAEELADLVASGCQESAKWARILLENSHDIIHVLSLKGTFLYVSPAAEKLLGYKPEEMVGKSISEFCHPSDVVPVFRELKDSTSNASIAAAAKQWQRYDGTVNPPTKGGSGQTGPQVNLIMRMKHKHHGHEWVENVGKLHLEQGKGRKVVISSGRLRPIYNLPWEQAQRSLNSRASGFWFKASTTGLILSTSGTVSDVVEGGSPTTEHIVPFAGKHVREFVNKEALGSLLAALRSLQVSAVPHMMSNALGGPAQMVISTVIPSSAGGQGLPTVFVYMQRANPNDFVSLQQNAVYCQDSNVAASLASQAATLKTGEPAVGSVFGELSTSRSSSWVFELHQLKNANKRLREEIRAHQRRISSGGRLTVGLPHQSPTRTKPATLKTPVVQRPALPQFHSSSNNGSISGGTNSGDSVQLSQSCTPYHSGSGTDTSMATSVSSQSTMSGVKRSRS